MGWGSLQYGATRLTQDLDICPELNAENLERLAQALTDLHAQALTDLHAQALTDLHAQVGHEDITTTNRIYRYVLRRKARGEIGAHRRQLPQALPPTPNGPVDAVIGFGDTISALLVLL